jgi:hypothetical protein
MKAARVLIFVLVGMGAITSAVVFGQTGAGEAKKSVVPPSADTPGGYVIQELAPGGPAFFAPAQDQSAQLVEQYRKSEKDEDKKEIRKKLANELGKQFDEHMKQQEKELANLEKQINDLKILMQKRQNARTTIIERRLDQLIHDAEGLGWNAPGHPQHAGLWARPGPVPYYRSPNAANRFPADKK